MTDNPEQRIEELTRVGLELHERCEQWRQALIEIERFNTDPMIAIILKKTLNN